MTKGMMILMVLMSAPVAAMPNDVPRLEIAGEWQVMILPGTVLVGEKKVRITEPATLDVPPATLVTVRDEKHDSLPLFDANAAPWMKGARLKQLDTFETTAAGMLVPESFVLKSGPGDAPKYVQGKDYALEAQWATVGRLAGGGIPEGKPVWMDYECGWGRIDSVVVNRQGKVSLREGKPHNATPLPPSLAPDETVIANIWVPGRQPKLTADNLYPILEPKYPEPKHSQPPAAKLLPKAWAKLPAGRPLHILAWGDSVTAGGQASDEAHRWQNRFVAHLKERFPKADITLTTAGWGGRNSDSFLQEPPSAEFNFDRAVIEPKPDLIVMEFVNDAWMTPEVVEAKYSYLLKRFREIGAEWVILTPHYVRPDWMGAKSDRVETDPRPYVTGVRQFAAKHGVALADASLRWGHLLKEGIPYVTLLSNSINHPDDRGHELFAQALMELFR
jgi:lysophospholipase L1-like esterase